MAAMDVAGAIANVKTMLSGLTAWQTICGVSTSAEAAKRIHLGGIEDDGSESLCPLIVLDIDPINTDWMQSTLSGDLVITADFDLSIPESERSSIAAQYIWTWQKFSEVLAGINGAVNGDGGLMLKGLGVPLKPGPIDNDDNLGRCEWRFGLSFTLRFI